MATKVLAFDIYGTLLDTASISQALSTHIGLSEERASEISALWRRYQLEYTWRLNSMEKYEPFDIVTRKSLQHALKESRIQYNEEVINNLMESYDVLPCFPDTKSALDSLKGLQTVKTLVFSNGTEAMVKSALEAATIETMADSIYVADRVRVYKPSPTIYASLVKAVGKEGSPEQCYLVSGNPFDVTGALSSGMSAIWVDRQMKGWSDNLLPIGDSQIAGPTKIVHSLSEVYEYISSLQ